MVIQRLAQRLLLIALGLIVGFGHDSTTRDFALLIGLVLLSGIYEFRGRTPRATLRTHLTVKDGPPPKRYDRDANLPEPRLDS